MTDFVWCFRGGRGDFKWEDVKGDQHRENYLGHSLMAREFHSLSFIPMFPVDLL